MFLSPSLPSFSFIDVVLDSSLLGPQSLIIFSVGFNWVRKMLPQPPAGRPK